MKANKILAFLTVILFFSGCGYTSRSLINEKYKSIYITPFVNKINIANESAGTRFAIYRPMLESDITRAVIDRFLFEGDLKPVEMTNADLVLKGELVEFRKDALRYTRDDNVEEYRVRIVVNISLSEGSSGKLLWQEDHFAGEETFFTSGPTASSETSAVNKALKDLSRRIVEHTVEQW